MAETGPKPQDESIVRRQRTILMSGKIPAGQRRDFTLIATFLVEEGHGYPRHTLWTPIFLNYDPEFCRLRITSQGAILLLSSEGNLLRAPILAADLRVIADEHVGLATVRESGYVLSDNYLLEGRNFRADEVERFILDAEDGIKPPVFSAYPFAKVDKSLAGKKVWEIAFNAIPAFIYPDDIVVIDLEKRELIERDVIYPLSSVRRQPRLIVEP